MKSICIGLFAAAVGCVCIQSVLAIEAAEAKETVLHSFDGTDGDAPMASLIDVNGVLYGTTEADGAYYGGTVFALDQTTGTEKWVYSFCSQANCADGASPYAGVIDANGTLYGTTWSGGDQGSCYDGCGTVFSLDTNTGAETVLHAFGSGVDASAPSASLIDVKGKLYGTTRYGGTNGKGTVFALNPNSGAERVLYSFCSQTNCTDGDSPFASLTHMSGTLYGTTGNGGTYGKGTVFAVDPDTGAETVLHSFGSGTDGVNPWANLIDVKGTLYGTTGNGGTYGGGTVFALDPNTGTETVLYSFGSGLDGRVPYAGLIDVKGALYGTTTEGGANDGGTVFVLDPNTGAETILYSFCRKQDCTDGEDPDAGLINVKGKLYGTTFFGGTFGFGDGTVFALKRP